MSSFIYLASQSPRRQELLKQIGIRFELLLAGPEEDAESLEHVHANESASAYVQRVAYAKTLAAAARLSARALPPAPILCADTTVSLDGQILGKPQNKVEALAMLSGLAGRSHEVFTAVCVRNAAGEIKQALSCSQVHFRACTAAELETYVATGEPFDKAGAYGLQGKAAVFVEKVSGSFSGIIGLPLFETAELLKWAGIAVM
jgi:septum formation protein